MWVCFIWPPNRFCAGHSNAVIVAGAAFGAHKIVIVIVLGQMGAFQATAVRSSAPDRLRAPPDGFGNRVIFYQADGAGFIVAGAGFPF